MAVIEVKDLRKRYGRLEALKGVSLSVRKGEIYGLLGRNGAGKTTLVKILLGLVRRTSGEVRLFGKELGPPSIRRRVGYLPEDHRLPEYHTPVSLLHMSGLLYGVPRPRTRTRTRELLSFSGLQDVAERKIRTLSKGMRQRLALVQALLHDPEIVFLDEPTDGVDPVGRRQIREMIKKLKTEGRTIFVNSHLLSEVEVTCDRVAIIEAGDVVRIGGIDDLTRRENLYEFKLVGSTRAVLPRLKEVVTGVQVVPGGLQVEVRAAEQIDKVVDLLRAHGIGIRGLIEKSYRLEDVFLRSIEQKG